MQINVSNFKRKKTTARTEKAVEKQVRVAKKKKTNSE